MVRAIPRAWRTRNEDRPPDWEKRWRILRLIVGTILLSVLAWQACRLPDRAGLAATSRLDPALANLNGTLGNINAASLAGKSLVETISKDYYDPKNPEAGWYWDIYAMLEASTAASRTSEEFIEDMRAAVMGGKDTKGVSHPGVIFTVTALLDSLKTTSDHFRDDLDTLTTSTNQNVLASLKTNLDNIAKLSDDLDRQMKDGGDVAGTFKQLDTAVANVNKLLEDPNIQKILADSAKTTGSISESAKTLEIAIRPYREKANQLKLILGKAVGLIKFVHAF